MYIFQYLKGENTRVDGLIEQAMGCDSPTERESIFYEIKKEITVLPENEDSTYSLNESDNSNYVAREKVQKRKRREERRHDGLRFVWTL